MRKLPKPNSPEGRQAMLERAERDAKREKRRLIAFSVALLFLVIAYFASQMQREQHLAREGEAVGQQEPRFNETVVVDEFDFSTIADKIRDAREEDRVLLSGDVTGPITDYVAGKNDAHFAALGVVDLDGERRAALLADPSAHRGEVYRVRGRLEEINSLERADGSNEYRGWLRGEGGEATHFVAMGVPEEIIFGDWMRLDGLFVKLHRDEDHEGAWVDGPLLIGAELVTSYPPFDPGELTTATVKSYLRDINDDSALQSTGLDGRVFDAQWMLINFAKTEAYARIDWENDAVELSNEVMTEILKDGPSWRFREAGAPDPRASQGPDGQRPALTQDLVPIPIRLPISRNMGINTFSPGENPSRIDQITEGWIGNTTWTNQASVVYFVLPEYRPDLTDMNDARLLTGKGFFVKNHNYESKGHGTRTAPFFVMTELERFTPEPSNLAQNIMWGVLALTLLLVFLFPYLLMRDRKKSEALQQDLVRRRQERRRRLAAAGEQAPS